MSLPSASQFAEERNEERHAYVYQYAVDDGHGYGFRSGAACDGCQGNVGRTDARRRDRRQITEIFAEKGSSYQGGHFPEDIG